MPTGIAITQHRAKFLAHGPDHFVQREIVAAVTCGGHPVRGQPHVLQTGYIGRGNIGDGFRHRQPGRGRAGVNGHRRALPHGHGLTRMTPVARRGHGRIGHRNLPGADHLIPGHQAAHGTVGYMDQERLIGHGGKGQHPLHRIAELDPGRVPGFGLKLRGGRFTDHLRRLAEQDVKRHRYRLVAEFAIHDAQVTSFGQLADQRIRTPLTLADALEDRRRAGIDKQDVALLGLVAPQFHGAHSRVVVGNFAQLDHGAAMAVVHDLRNGVGQPAGADIMNRKNRVGAAQCPAGIDDLLGAPLHLGVAALHRSEIKVLLAGAAACGRRGAAAKTDQHGRPAEHHHPGARRRAEFLHLLRADVAQPAGDHDRFVIPTPFTAAIQQAGSKITGDVRPAELIVEPGTADRSFQHDVERRGDMPGPPRPGPLPGAPPTGDLQVRNREPGEPRFRGGAPCRWRPRRESLRPNRSPRPARAKWRSDGCAFPPS